MKTYILYHKNCTDGFGGAYAAWKKFYDTVDYIPISHSDPVPVFEKRSLIYVIDYCFSKEINLELRKENTVITLDHHISSADAIKSSTEYVFDLDRSGSKIAWEYFHPGTECKVIDYISDKDLGQFKLPNSREIISAIESYPRDFKTWDNFTIDKLIQEGRSILRGKNIEVEYAADRVIFENIGGYKIPVVNSQVYMNEIAEVLIQRHPECKFVAVYYEYENEGTKMLKYSLRSKETDVNKIAAKFGGGGHTLASAFLKKVNK